MNSVKRIYYSRQIVRACQKDKTSIYYAAILALASSTYTILKINTKAGFVFQDLREIARKVGGTIQNQALVTRTIASSGQTAGNAASHMSKILFVIFVFLRFFSS